MAINRNLAVRVNWYEILAKNGINTEYNPKCFHAIIQRCRLKEGTSVTALVFRTGRVVMTGGAEQKQCQTAAMRICRRINQACYGDLKHETRLKPFAVYRFQIDNVACAFKCSHQLAIERLYENYCRRPQQFHLDSWKVQMTYRPTTFTGLRIKFEKKQHKKERVALMLFINGNVTLSGMKNVEESRLFAQEFHTHFLSKYDRSTHILT